MAEVVQALEGTLVPMQCVERARRAAACSATTRSTATRTAPRSCCGPASRAASTRALEQTTLAELAQFAERGAAPRRPPRTTARRALRAARAHDQPQRTRRSEPYPMADLEIQNLHVNVEGKEILRAST